MPHIFRHTYTEVNRRAKNNQADNVRMGIGGRVKMLREAAGLTQSELARRIGIKPPSLWLIESGDTKTVKGATLMRLSEALNADPAWLSSGRGAPYRMAVAGPDEGELVSIYRNLPPDSQKALLGAARGLLMANPKPSKADPYKVSKKA